MPERIELHTVHGKRRLRRWRSGTLNGHDEQTISVGRLGDGRFWASHTGIHGGAFVYDTEREADTLAEGWLCDGREWHPIPASFGPDGMPNDGAAWIPHGQTWLPG